MTKENSICFVEYDWTFGVYRFRIGQTFTDFRGVRSWESLKDCRADLKAAGCYLGKRTDSLTWPVHCGDIVSLEERNRRLSK